MKAIEAGKGIGEAVGGGPTFGADVAKNTAAPRSGNVRRLAGAETRTGAPGKALAVRETRTPVRATGSEVATARTRTPARTTGGEVERRGTAAPTRRTGGEAGRTDDHARMGRAISERRRRFVASGGETGQPVGEKMKLQTRVDLKNRIIYENGKA